MDLACLLGRQDLVSHFWWLLWGVLAPVSSNFWMTGSTGSGHNLKFDFWEFSEDFSTEPFQFDTHWFCPISTHFLNSFCTLYFC
jgi:hypothetical protein